MSQLYIKRSLDVLAVAAAYMNAALINCEDEHGWPLGLSGYSVGHIDEATRQTMLTECADFLLTHESWCMAASLSSADVGRYLWLARNGEDAFTNIEDDICLRLTTAARLLGAQALMPVGEDVLGYNH